MKTTIHYNTKDPESYRQAMIDIQDYLGERYLSAYSIFLECFDPCTWRLEDFHFFLGMYGIEGFPCRAFAFSIMESWEATQ